MKENLKRAYQWLRNNYEGCDLQILSVNSVQDKEQIIKNFNSNFPSNTKAYAQLIIWVEDAKEWTIVENNIKPKAFKASNLNLNQNEAAAPSIEEPNEFLKGNKNNIDEFKSVVKSINQWLDSVDKNAEKSNKDYHKITKKVTEIIILAKLLLDENENADLAQLLLEYELKQEKYNTNDIIKFVSIYLGSKKEQDEIYLFGFSRGAYTALALVGFLSWCGLLKHNAPNSLSLDTLFERFLNGARRKQEHAEEIVNGSAEIKPEGVWRFFDIKYVKELRYFKKRIDSNKSGQQNKAEELVDYAMLFKNQQKLKTNEAKQLLVYSQPPKVKFLGVFDTVRASNWEAIVSGLYRDKISPQWLKKLLENGTLTCRYTRHVHFTVENAYQALAIDENRYSFGERVWETPQNPSPVVLRHAEQRWFVGAHANVGGGYPNDSLSFIPLKWMQNAAQRCGLKFEDNVVLPECKTSMTFGNKVYDIEFFAPINDSYKEFRERTWNLKSWKRYFRDINAKQLGQDYSQKNNNFDKKKDLMNINNKRVNETLDISVINRFKNEEAAYCPGKLLSCLEKTILTINLCKETQNVCKEKIEQFQNGTLEKVEHLVLSGMMKKKKRKI